MPSELGETAARVLVVDDEPLNRDLIRRVLHNTSEVTEAGDVDEALAVMESSASFDLVLCDQMMPGRSGTDLAIEVHERWPDTIFMLITGYDDDPKVIEAQKDELIDVVVPKPWTARGLKQLILEALARD